MKNYTPEKSQALKIMKFLYLDRILKAIMLAVLPI